VTFIFFNPSTDSNFSRVSHMSSNKSVRPPLAKLPSITRTRVDLEKPSLVRVGALAADQPLPLVVTPVVSGLDPTAWAADNAALIESHLLGSGALLFRGFDLRTADDFGRFVGAISGAPLEYRERSSPRSAVGDRIYTSTDYPAEQTIFPHNEHSYATTFPLKLYFYCERPAAQGGETPLADCRRVLRRLAPRTRERFIEKRWMYVRNFGDGFGLPWQTVFQTADKAAVEAYCRAGAIQVEWKQGDRLRTRQVRPAIIRHPRTGEPAWFNHATFFHLSTLPPAVQAELLAGFGEADLPNNTYYGDGSPIEPEVLDELRAAYLNESVSFAWEAGDVVLLDNIATAHARNGYAGARKILFAMAEPHTRNDL
jgi:alpha-ketoglutarate-dependent taurine dioxygenase